MGAATTATWRSQSELYSGLQCCHVLTIEFKGFRRSGTYWVL